MTLRAYDREDGKYVIHDDEGSPDAWMVVDPAMIMQDPALATKRQTTVDDWTTDADRTSEPSTSVDDWEPK